MSGSLFSRTYRFVALDVETANGDSGSICQLGLAMVDHDGVIQTASFMIDPEVRFAPFNTQLHGIGPDTVAGQPRFGDVIEPLRDFLTRHVLVQHSQFDQKAIGAACRRYDLPNLSTRWLNSVQVARKAWPQLRGNGGHGLGNLQKVLRLNFKHHDAAEDSKAAAQVILLAEAELGFNFIE
ncbi:exonuclease [Parasedimentitalea marina]|uniref:Exonuclease n=1 Tax=Parasedimentitalea marina TaxID=2483033 RepID=A0A3T0N3I4_9RHOB|nr:exonuclease domain-containing protein [Parasedimentitalea marina]AZV78588.1 exonuclease [Parasedimentitalea marina]